MRRGNKGTDGGGNQERRVMEDRRMQRGGVGIKPRAEGSRSAAEACRRQDTNEWIQP